MLNGLCIGRLMRHLILISAAAAGIVCTADGDETAKHDAAVREKLDAPLLFTKRFNYNPSHIYDTYYTYRPGGGIYVLENPAAEPSQQKIRPVIDPTTPETLGEGVYSEPDLSWDGRRLLFCFKGESIGSTSIYEIGIDGRGLRRVTDPRPFCDNYKGRSGGQHDVCPAYLPDGRIVFKSTRPSGLVPCFNSGVDILHVMNADGSDIHPISVNNVNEFDPTVLPDGRILYGRWEYVDKTALTQQSLWTIFPDGTNETALFANNMVYPEAVLDARPVPGARHLVIGSFTSHGKPYGTIAMIDTRRGKNDPRAIANFERPDKPTFNWGKSCDPWPLSKDLALYSGRPEGSKYNVIMTIDRHGRRTVVYADGGIDCHSPIPVKPRPCPPVIPSMISSNHLTGRFCLQDIYQGLDGVERGEVKWLRVIEETSRVSPTPGWASSPYNQTFLLSAALAFSVKNYLGVVPVQPDGSAYFEVPSHRAIYLQALDAEGRLIHSMRTFVQAAPGVTRSCIGCHENKYSAAANIGNKQIFKRKPAQLMPESWGSGFIDYPSQVQPIFDKHCVKCHGGEKGFAGRLDLSGGWTEHFNISYENLVSRRENQVTASLIAGIDCMNGTSLWSARILPPRSHGSGAAPLAKVLVSGHENRIANLSRRERDLILAWIDTNGLYHGTWDYSQHGCSVKSWSGTFNALVARMRQAGCMQCHSTAEHDWFNLQRPESSRMLRAPLASSADGPGLGLCRSRKVDGRNRRIYLLVRGYKHGAEPIDSFKVPQPPPVKNEGEPVATFASTADPHYRAMLEIIRNGRREALAAPRVDMPGAVVEAGACRRFVPTPLPDELPPLQAKVNADGVVRLAWERSAATIGLSAEVHRGTTADFAPGIDTLLSETRLFAYADMDASPGVQHYALILCSAGDHSEPIRTSVNVPPLPPKPPGSLTATPLPAPAKTVVDCQYQDGKIQKLNVTPESRRKDIIIVPQKDVP